MRAVPLGRVTLLANGILVLLLAYTLAGITWMVIQGGSAPAAPAVVSLQPESPSTGSAAPSLEQLAQMHLLGEAGAVAAPEPAEAIDAPETRLNLELKGLFAVDTPEAAMAIIAVSGKDEMSYRVGQSVAGAAMVHQILSDRVILKRGDRFETLTLPKDRIPEADSARASTPVSRSTGGRNLVPLNRDASVRALPGLRERIMSDPQQAMTLIKAQPVMMDGQMQGYRVSPGDERDLFAQAGLRPNDVVTQVNGIPLSDPSQLGQLMEQFSNSPRVDLTVERGGRPVNLSLDLQ